MLQFYNFRVQTMSQFHCDAQQTANLENEVKGKLVFKTFIAYPLPVFSSLMITSHYAFFCKGKESSTKYHWVNTNLPSEGQKSILTYRVIMSVYIKSEFRRGCCQLRENPKVDNYDQYDYWSNPIKISNIIWTRQLNTSQNRK